MSREEYNLTCMEMEFAMKSHAYILFKTADFIEEKIKRSVTKKEWNILSSCIINNKDFMNIKLPKIELCQELIDYKNKIEVYRDEIDG